MTAEAEGWVLAGGRSRRMGAHKAALPLKGASMLERMLAKLRGIGLQPKVAGLSAPVADLRAEALPDRLPDRGPLSGLETALRSSAAPLVLVVAVDLPLVEPSFLAWMVERAGRTGAMATIPRALGVPQPLCAVYRRDLLGRVKGALERQNYKVMAAVTNAGDGDDLFDVERLAAAGAWPSRLPAHLQFLNCNRPADAARVSAILSRAPML